MCSYRTACPYSEILGKIYILELNFLQIQKGTYIIYWYIYHVLLHTYEGSEMAPHNKTHICNKTYEYLHCTG
jgi:hypothetical protein